MLKKTAASSMPLLTLLPFLPPLVILYTPPPSLSLSLSVLSSPSGYCTGLIPCTQGTRQAAAREMQARTDTVASRELPYPHKRHLGPRHDKERRSRSGRQALRMHAKSPRRFFFFFFSKPSGFLPLRLEHPHSTFDEMLRRKHPQTRSPAGHLSLSILLYAGPGQNHETEKKKEEKKNLPGASSSLQTYSY
ncbi:hypothetical protein LX36DRAFT_103557 [Colletotrichum falcatum]|nr:hypothetical protein LX36DRAFT_103557 [Colletotrichum falcatum]